MNSPRAQEMDKLQRIQSQVHSVAVKIDERLPHQRATVAALVCAWHWRLRTIHARHTEAYTHELVDAIVKRIRLQVGTFEYTVKEQGELLTRYLCELDNILSQGNTEIKEARKTLVVEIQMLLERADTVKTSATRLKDFAQHVLDSLPPATESMQTTEDVAMDDATPADNDEAGGVEAAQTGPESEEEQASLHAMFDESEDSESDSEEEEEEEEDQNQDDDQSTAMEDANETSQHQTTTQTQEDHDDTACLPVWRPYYQIQKHEDGVYIIANLHGVDPRHLRVESVPCEGVIRIAGVKFPTQKGMLLSQLSGAPTFGRFEIVERFPVGALALDHASQQILRDGTLQVRLPFAVRQVPRVVRRVSPYMLPGLTVW